MYGSLHYSGLGAPGLDTLAQMTSPPFVETPPIREALNYAGLGAPGIDTLSQFSVPSYVEAPPIRVPLEYAAPHIIDMAMAAGHPMPFTPPHRMRLEYGADDWLKSGVTYNLNGVLYTYNAQDGSFNVIPTEGPAYVLPKGGDPRYLRAMDALRAAYGSQTSGGGSTSGGSTGGGGIWDSIKSWFRSGNAAKDIGTAVGTIKAGAAGGQTSQQPPPEEGFWSKYGTTVAIAGGAAALGTVLYFALRQSPEAGVQLDRMALRANRRKPKKSSKKGKSKSKSKARR